MTWLPARVPTTALLDFTALYVPRATGEGTVVELRIKIVDTDLNVRELGAYLSFIDRIYGRLSQLGLRNYSQSAHRQLRISEIRVGSIDIIIRQIVNTFTDATPLVILWLVLKYLPTAAKTFSESAKNTADAYKSYQEAAEIRDKRKRLREEVKQDQTIQQLGTDRINQLVRLISALLDAEEKQLSAPARFAQKKVISVELVVRPSTIKHKQAIRRIVLPGRPTEKPERIEGTILVRVGRRGGTNAE